MPVSAATMLYYNGFGSGLGSASRQGRKHDLSQFCAGLRDPRVLDEENHATIRVFTVEIADLHEPS